MPGPRAEASPRAWIIERPEASTVQIWGLSPEERLRRTLHRLGCTQVEALGPEGAASPTASGSALLLRSDAIFDERLVQGLLGSPDTVLVAPQRGDDGWGGPVAAHVQADRLADALSLLRPPVSGGPGPAPRGLRLASPGELVPAYNATLRKLEPPYLFRARADDVREIEDRIFAASYKGFTDLVTKWLWPRPAAAVTRLLVRARVQPNAVTTVSWILAILAAWLFAVGGYGLGLVIAWLMTFLDTVDGKLARVTLTSSRFGHIFDHSLDLLHPPFWYLAWGLGLAGGAEMAMAIVIGGYVVGRLLEGAFLLAFQIEAHCWRPIDSMFRTITARRNPNLLLLTVGALGGRPDLGLVMVAIWTLASLGFHSVRLVQAFALRRRGEAIQPWGEALRADPRPEEAAPDGPVDADRRDLA